MNELSKDENALSGGLKSIKNKFEDEIKKREVYKYDIYKEINYLVDDIINNKNNEINNPRKKIEFYMNNQQNIFYKINKDIKEGIEEINSFCNNDIQYSNQKYNKMINDITSFKDKIYISDKKESLNRGKFKEDISFILNSEIDSLNKNEMMSSIELIKNRKNNF